VHVVSICIEALPAPGVSQSALLFLRCSEGVDVRLDRFLASGRGLDGDSKQSSMSCEAVGAGSDGVNVDLATGAGTPVWIGGSMGGTGTLRRCTAARCTRWYLYERARRDRTRRLYPQV
jgi:hypothetical protein